MSTVETAAAPMLRVPPHSAEAEQSVLGGLLLDNGAWDRVGTLTEADFYRHEHRTIFAVLADMLNACRTADVITVGQRLNDLGKGADCGGMSYLNALAQSVPSAANIRRYAEIVREKAVLRAVIQAADAAATEAFGGESAAVTLDRASSAFAALERQQVRKVPRSLGEIAIQRVDYYTDVSEGKVSPGWRTHIPTLTAMLNGGLRPGSLYILAARPSVGKSSFAQDLAMHLAQDEVQTLFLSLEMPEAEVADRSVASLGRVSYSALQTGKMSDEDWSRTSEAMERALRLPFMVDDQPALTLRDIRAKAKLCKGLRVLVLDYLQLCASTRKDGNRNSEIEEISRGLKALAKELGIAVIALSQLNRDVERRASKRPGLADLRDSGAIEQDADVVMFLWPVREFPAEGRRIVGCGIDKNRQGRCGEFGLDFFGDVQQWRESSSDIRPEPASGRGFE